MGDPQREKKIVATFLQQGHLLTPAALERLAAKAIVPSDKKFDALIIDTDQLEESVSYNILKNFTQKPSVISKTPRNARGTRTTGPFSCALPVSGLTTDMWPTRSASTTP